jgi:predicted acylesterase/phospholipase RssA
MQSAALTTKLRSCPPDIYVRPRVGNIRIFDFAKAQEVFEQAEPAIADLRAQLARRGLTSSVSS